VFAHNCHEAGLISDTEWSIYCDWHSFLLNALPLRFHGIIYLRTDPKVGGRGWKGGGEGMGKGGVCICDRLPINHPLAAFCRNWD